MRNETSLRWPIIPSRSLLLVIDMQNDFVRPGAVMEVPAARERLPAMQAVLDSCRQYGVPVAYTRHVLYDDFNISPIETQMHPQLVASGLRDNTPGTAVVDELAPRAGDAVIVKHRYDAFYNTNLETLIRTMRGDAVIDTLIIIGTVTSVCCESTARSAFMRDFKVAFVGDATGGFDDASQQATQNAIESAFGQVISAAGLARALAQG
ncbi:isochorismatase family protein [Kerstersia sp.]|uniref:isochorismatase family protein n=1 Tax=Kerstersia sp. TaxID=1930783 RepID=UPI003F9163ED